MNNRLDIYIVTYNRIEMLRKAVNAVLSQTFKDFNLYILDNASTVDVESLVKSYNDDRIIYIRHDENIGGLGNIKYAFDHCDSDYVIVLHDDDIIDKELIDIELKALINDDEIIAISCNADIIDENDRVIGNYEYSCNDNVLYIVDKYFVNYLNTGKTLVFPSTMYNNRLLKHYNIVFNTTVGPCADVIFHADIERTGKKIAISNRRLIKYRQHSLQDSSINTIPMLLMLYKHIVNDRYYSQFMVYDKSLQLSLFSRLSNTILSRYIHDSLECDQAITYLDEMASILHHNRFVLLVYKLILLFIHKLKMIINAFLKKND